MSDASDTPPPRGAPPTEQEVLAAGSTMFRPCLDDASLRNRLACAAALLGGLPAPPDQPCLVHEVSAAAPPAVILIGDGVEVGRQSEGPGCVPDCAELSRRHFRVFPRQGGFAVEDLGSRNGTLIDGLTEPVKRRVLRDGDFIIAGMKVFLFVNPE